MPSIILLINVKHQVSGKIIQETLEGVSLSDLEKMEYIFLDLPGSFIDKNKKLYEPNAIVECKCIINNFVRFAKQPNCPRGRIVVTPLLNPENKSIGPREKLVNTKN